MRRTGKDLESPATGSEACGGAGITKEAAFMEGLGGVRVRIAKTALRGCADRRQTGLANVSVLQTEERGVASAATQQVVMLAAFHDFAAPHHQDRIGLHAGVRGGGKHDGG